MEQRCEFTTRLFGDAMHHVVYRKTWLEGESDGETVKISADDNCGEDGLCVGMITENEYGVFTAEYDTSFIDSDGTPTYRAVKIEGVFATLEDAVRAVEENYDPARDHLLDTIR